MQDEGKDLKNPLENQRYVPMPWEESSSDEEGRKEGDEEEDDSHLLKSMRVIIRVRPILQGEAGLGKRNMTNTSGQMLIERPKSTIHLKYDARNKETKSYQFDQVCDGEMGQQEFFKSSGISQMIKKVV